MAERLSALRQPFSMQYCTRSADRTAFRERIRRSSFAPAVQFHLDDGHNEQKLEIPALLCAPQEGVHVYTCGPKGFMDAVLSTARRSGWPEEQLHYVPAFCSRSGHEIQAGEGRE